MATFIKGLRDPYLRAMLKGRLAQDPTMAFTECRAAAACWEEEVSRSPATPLPSPPNHCYVCGQPDHRAETCPDRHPTTASEESSQDPPPPTRTKTEVSEYKDMDIHPHSRKDAAQFTTVAAMSAGTPLDSSIGPHVTVPVTLAGSTTDVLIDTGSQVSIIPSSLRWHLGVELEDQPPVALSAVNGSYLVCEGGATLDVEAYGETIKDVKFFVVPDNYSFNNKPTPCILGMNVLRHIPQFEALLNPSIAHEPSRQTVSPNDRAEVNLVTIDPPQSEGRKKRVRKCFRCQARDHVVQQCTKPKPRKKRLGRNPKSATVKGRRRDQASCRDHRQQRKPHDLRCPH